ncbi:MAG TPA: hypothetical protein VKY89_20825, partial [Thermoanaerobaculia bacterium]|nr:hypothetical protein [Thermoanaerobaculia bacterium]
MRLRPEAALVSLGMSLLVAPGCGSPEPPPRSPAEAMALLAAIPELRPVAPRLTGLQGYAPCLQASRGGGAGPSFTCSPVFEEGGRAARDLERVRRALAAHPQAPDFAAVAGLWFLIHSAAPGAADRAVDRLEAAVLALPGNADLQNDLAAAYLVRGDVMGRPTDFLLALDTLERSLALESGLEAARFNRGLVFERLGLCAPAAAAWRDYLGADPSSGWAHEAASRRSSMSCDWPEWQPVKDWATATSASPPAALARLLDLAPVEASRRALEELLPAWAATWLAGDLAKAHLQLARLRHLGDALSARTGDATIVKLAADLEADGEPRRAQLALAYQDLGEAARLQGASLYALALERYRRALRASGGLPAPAALWASYGVLSTLVTEEDYSAARRALADLRRDDLAGMPTLAARIAWSEGLMQLRSGAFAESRQSFAAAAATYTRLHDGVSAGAARALEAESLQALGLDEEAWRLRIEAFRALGRRPSGPLHNLLVDAALASREEGRPHAALALQTAGLAVARALRSPSRTVEALLWRSKILTALGRSDEARADLQSALSQAPGIADLGVRRRLSADLQEAYGELLLEHDPAAAAAAFSVALRFYQETAFAWKLPSVLLLRARARLRLGQEAFAAADLAAAVDEFERRDRAMPPDVFRYSHLERAQETFDAMIRLQLDRHRPDLALVYAERARLATWPAPVPAARRAAAGVQALSREAAVQAAVKALPPDVAVIELAILDDHLLTWVLYAGRTRFLARPLAGLPARVEAFWNALAAPGGQGSELAAMAAALYGDLVAPWAGEVPAGTRLVFAPDRFLYRVAFAALRDPARRRWLAQDFVVSTAPSLLFAAGALRPPPTQAGGVGRGSALLVGDPGFDPGETGELPALPGAA